MAAKPKQVDWEAVEIDVRAGILTFVQMAKKHGVSGGRIAQVKKEKGWTRDVAAKIKARTEEKLNAAALNGKVNARKKLSEAAIIEAGAKLHASILLTHRAEIAESRAIVRTLLLELRRATKKQHDLPSRAVIAQRLVNAQATLIEKERQAYGVGGNNDETKQTLPEWLEAA
jgi:hypothetical protein